MTKLGTWIMASFDPKFAHLRAIPWACARVTHDINLHVIPWPVCRPGQGRRQVSPQVHPCPWRNWGRGWLPQLVLPHIAMKAKLTFTMMYCALDPRHAMDIIHAWVNTPEPKLIDLLSNNVQGFLRWCLGMLLGNPAACKQEQCGGHRSQITRPKLWPISGMFSTQFSNLILANMLLTFQTMQRRRGGRHCWSYGGNDGDIFAMMSFNFHSKFRHCWSSLQP